MLCGTRDWRGAKKQRGFTLLEVMLALAVGGIVLAGAFAITASTLELSNDVERVQAEESERRAVIAFLRREFRALPPQATVNLVTHGETSGAGTRLVIRGAPLAFRIGAYSGYEWVEVSLRQRAKASRELWLRYGESDDVGQEMMVGEIMLSRRVLGVQWRYWDLERETWSEEWGQAQSTASQRPEVIELRYLMEEGPWERALFWIPKFAEGGA